MLPVTLRTPISFALVSFLSFRPCENLGKEGYTKLDVCQLERENIKTDLKYLWKKKKSFSPVDFTDISVIGFIKILSKSKFHSNILE